MRFQPVAQAAGGLVVPQNRRDLELAIAELKHKWAGYAELGPMLKVLEQRLKIVEETS
jgi:hypothetical protein